MMAKVTVLDPRSSKEEVEVHDVDGLEVVAKVDGEAEGEMKGDEEGDEDGYVKEKVTASQWQCDQVIPEWKPWKFHVLPHSSQLYLIVTFFPTL